MICDLRKTIINCIINSSTSPINPPPPAHPFFPMFTNRNSFDSICRINYPDLWLLSLQHWIHKPGNISFNALNIPRLFIVLSSFFLFFFKFKLFFYVFKYIFYLMQHNKQTLISSECHLSLQENINPRQDSWWCWVWCNSIFKQQG